MNREKLILDLALQKKKLWIKVCNNYNFVEKMSKAKNKSWIWL